MDYNIKKSKIKMNLTKYIDNEIIEALKEIDIQRIELLEKSQTKAEKVERQMEELNEHRAATFDQIDQFFEDIVKRARKRAEYLKKDFDHVQ